MAGASLLVHRVAQIYESKWNKELAAARGLVIEPISWEDTRRQEKSSYGPNICDMTLDCQGALMPLIRKPNLSDLTADIPISKLKVTIGNEQQHNAPAQRVPLKQYIEQIGIHNTRTYNSASSNLILPRDDTILMSVQTCLLPLHADSGESDVEFVPRIYSYQSEENKPTVLVMVASPYGTSAQVIHHADQALFFNRGGIATRYTAKTLAQIKHSFYQVLMSSVLQNPSRQPGVMTAAEQEDEILLIYSIPLIPQKGARASDDAGIRPAQIFPSTIAQGRFPGLEQVQLVRDPEGPIRLTVQIYKAMTAQTVLQVTDSSEIKDSEMHNIAAQLQRVFSRCINEPSSLSSGPSSRTTAPGLPALRAIQAPTNRDLDPLMLS
ncbi:hypothetical protein MMC07_006820 [Pseudocyphellaria aurata]|nr:hypothetical protein [Pseudocyphellaria aurata]